MQAIYPLIAWVVCLVFAALVLRQYFERRKVHQLIWAIALFITVFGIFSEFYSEIWGWSVLLYRFYYVAAASLVAFLGLGTAYLILPKRIAHVFLAAFLLIIALFLWTSLKANVDITKLVTGATVAGRAMPGQVRLFSPLLTIPGTALLLGGAIYSVLFFLKKRKYPYRVWANIFIAAGAIVIAAAGSFARVGQTQYLYPAEMVGITLLFVGFLMANKLT